MYLSADSPTRSLRTATSGDDELLLVGGNGHVVGQHSRPTRELVDDLAAWTLRHFPGAERTHVWSAQDYQSHNHVPFVGLLPRGGGHVWLATGYGKWGMSNAPMAALNLTAQILGGHQDWADVLGTRVSKPASFVEAAASNAGVGVASVRGWLGAQLNGLGPEDRVPAEGVGVVGRAGNLPVARATVGGRTCAVSAVCTHLGGIVKYNDLEQSWDCPLHGSRFAADGTVLEGPAVKPLAPEKS